MLARNYESSGIVDRWDSSRMLRRLVRAHLVGIRIALLYGTRSILFRGRRAAWTTARKSHASIDTIHLRTVRVPSNHRQEDGKLQDAQEEQAQAPYKQIEVNAGRGVCTEMTEPIESKNCRHHNGWTNMPESFGDPLGDEFLRIRPVHAAYDHACHVDPDAQKHERQDAVHRGVREACPHVNAVARKTGLDNGNDAAARPCFPRAARKKTWTSAGNKLRVHRRLWLPVYSAAPMFFLSDS